MDMAVPQILSKIGEVVSLFLEKRVQQRIDEQIVDVPARRGFLPPQVVEQLAASSGTDRRYTCAVDGGAVLW